MSGLERIVTPERIYEPGDLFKACTGALCRFYVVRRVQATRDGFVNAVEETENVRGGRAIDPMIARYDELRKAGESKKQAALAARQKFGVSRSQFYKRLAAR